MSISELAIRRPVMAWMLMSALIIFGGISFTRMGVSQLPDVDFPMITVSTNYTGAAPEVMETEIVDVIENTLMTIQGVKRVTSSSKNGSATITVELELDRNIDAAFNDVQAKIQEAARRLPKDMDPPSISKINPDDQPIIWIAVQSDRLSRRDLMEYVRDHIQQQFSTTEDVGDINLGGFIEPNLRVWVSERDLNKYSLTVADVIQTITNEHSAPPAGTITQGNKEFNVRTLGEATTVEEFENLVITSRGGSPNYVPIQLKQVAKVEDGLNDIRRISRSGGLPSVGLGIRKQRGSNAVAVAESVIKKLNAIRKTLPEGIALTIRFDSTRFIKEAVGELNFTLLLSAILTGLVCWLFIGSWSSTMNVLLSIPTSVLGTFIVLYFCGFTLNTFTLLGLSLAIGIIVDDAIMVLENIVRHKELGLSRMDASIVGSKEITFAAIAATVSIVAIFLPVAFMQGVIGKFFMQLGVTMSVAVLLSLVEALTLTPMRCSQFLQAGHRTSRFGKWADGAMEKAVKRYTKFLTMALNHRWKVVFASLVFFICSFGLIKFLNAEMAPPEDRSSFLMRAQTPVGSSLDYTDSKLKQVEDYLSKRPEVEGYFAAVGGFGGSEVNTGVIFVTLKDKKARGTSPEGVKNPTQMEFMNVCRKDLSKIGDLKVVLQDLSMRGFGGGGRGFPVEFTIQGPDWDQLGEYSRTIMERLKATGLVTDLDSDYQVGMPEVQIIPDRKKAAIHGVSISTIGQTINALIGGQVAGRFEKGGRRNDIRVKLIEDDRNRIEVINGLFVRNNRGELIRLSSVVQIEQKPSLQAIYRRDRERAITIFANVAKGKSQQIALDEAERIGKEILPLGYRVVLSGGAEQFKSAFKTLWIALFLGLLVAYMVLASQFDSYIDPFTVLMALPFSLSGAFIGLLIGQQSINIYSGIGLLLLMGIVKKNSILLVDFTNQTRRSGVKDVRNALEKACPTRLRPILMTSIATIAGAIPPALAIGPGAETRVPMATAVIGGVIVSTFLTLFVVPCVYSLLSKLERRTFVVLPEAHA